MSGARFGDFGGVNYLECGPFRCCATSLSARPWPISPYTSQLNGLQHPHPAEDCRLLAARLNGKTPMKCSKRTTLHSIFAHLSTGPRTRVRESLRRRFASNGRSLILFRLRAACWRSIDCHHSLVCIKPQQHRAAFDQRTRRPSLRGRCGIPSNASPRLRGLLLERLCQRFLLCESSSRLNRDAIH